MPSALYDPAVRTVLDRLFGAAQGDGSLMASLLAGLAPGAVIERMPAAELADLAGEAYLPVAPEVGTLLYTLARASRPALVVEFGTSFGISTIHLAAALRDNGSGQIVTSELSASKVRAAEANVAEAGLGDLVDVRAGDALETLRDLPGPADLVLLDGWNHIYLQVLRVLEPNLRPGTLIIADDTVRFADETRDYLDHVQDPANGYTTVHLPLDDGLTLSTRH
ncbi:putative O-methyltransferase [Frankia canadensis]|uniref:Putative O-methyltransferase n=1 Tax=Frankia canadensis TaxID=1836972 RepID=A0A2I2KZS2_9ACTN|nr:class I SAM-dependent methyltransferase [Frankia canadensis]SNQ51163.1 putative O-methyltransferase [Frankia canadensis]SOU58453.1 putative O-methyltransferase [Frankia canadensis]